MDDIFYKKTNRDKSRTPKKGLYWCWKCDRNLVSKGQKCDVCGAKPVCRTNKKDQS